MKHFIRGGTSLQILDLYERLHAAETARAQLVTHLFLTVRNPGAGSFQGIDRLAGFLNWDDLIFATMSNEDRYSANRRFDHRLNPEGRKPDNPATARNRSG
jgi:hypothetical protein